MLKSIKEMRVNTTEGSYLLILEIPEKIVFSTYDDPDENSIIDLTKRYLMYSGEEGVPIHLNVKKEKEFYKVELELVG